MDRVIDYAHSPIRSEMMDIFCAAKCRFFLGTSSGMFTVASVFGVPVVMTNGMPAHMIYDLSGQDLYLFKNCWSLSEDKQLNTRSLFSPPVMTASSQYRYGALGLRVEDNTPEEINEVVIEMLERLDHGPEYSEQDERLQQQFRALARECIAPYANQDVGPYVRIGKDFLSRHASHLFDQK